MMTEEEILDLLSEYLDGTLDKPTRAAVEEGLARYPPARRVLTEMQGAVSLLAALPKVAAPADLAGSIRTRAEGRELSRRASHTLMRHAAVVLIWRRLMPMAAVLAVGCLAAWAFRRAEEQIAPTAHSPSAAPATVALAPDRPIGGGPFARAIAPMSAPHATDPADASQRDPGVPERGEEKFAATGTTGQGPTGTTGQGSTGQGSSESRPDESPEPVEATGNDRPTDKSVQSDLPKPDVAAPPPPPVAPVVAPPLGNPPPSVPAPEPVAPQTVVSTGREAPPPAARANNFAGAVVISAAAPDRIYELMREGLQELESAGLARWSVPPERLVRGQVARLTVTARDPRDLEKVLTLLARSPDVTGLAFAPSRACRLAAVDVKSEEAAETPNAVGSAPAEPEKADAQAVRRRAVKGQSEAVRIQVLALYRSLNAVPAAKAEPGRTAGPGRAAGPSGAGGPGAGGAPNGEAGRAAVAAPTAVTLVLMLPPDTAGE
jgi:hypothetical protein